MSFESFIAEGKRMAFHHLTGVIAAIAVAISAAPAQAQDTAAVDEIVVTGSRDQVRTELKNMLNVSAGQIARFEDPLCPLIVGFDAEYSGYLRSLILANAQALGVPVGKTGCQANALVIFTDQPHALVAAMRQHIHWAFGDLSLPKRDRLTKPVRTSYSWHANYTTNKDGSAAVDGDAQFGGGLGGAFSGIPVIRAFTPTRLYSPAISVMGGAYLVLDITRTPGMTLDQIADFATLHLVVDLDEGAARHARPDSILGLFDADDPADVAPRMGIFDRALVNALYEPADLAQEAGRMRMRLASLIKRENAGGPD